MSDKDLQTLTECVSYIGQTSAPRALPDHRHHFTQKVRNALQRTLYLSVHDDQHPAEVFLRVNGADSSSELIDLYDVIARLTSRALRYEKVGDLLAGAKLAPCGPVVGHASIKHCSSSQDLTSRHLLVKCCGSRHELGHVPVATEMDTAHDFGREMLTKA